MNRKAKVAYAHIIIGFLIFLVGLVTILNHTLSKNDDEEIDDFDVVLNSASATSKLALLSSDVGLKVNFSTFLSPSSSGGKDTSRSKLEYDQEEDVDIYIKRYCHMRRQKQLIGTSGNLEATTTKFTGASGNGPREVRSSEESNRYASLQYSSSFRSTSSSFLNNLFGFLICSTDTIYLIMIVCLALFGSLVLLYGCVRFYENDVRLINRSVLANNDSG